MKKPIIAGTVLAIGLCSGLLSSGIPANARPKQDDAKVKTAAQAANIARLHYINGGRGVVYKGKPETLLNWKKPLITRRKSKQGNLLWDVLFSVPDRKAAADFAIIVAPNGKVVRVINFFG